MTSFSPVNASQPTTVKHDDMKAISHSWTSHAIQDTRSFSSQRRMTRNDPPTSILSTVEFGPLVRRPLPSQKSFPTSCTPASTQTQIYKSIHSHFQSGAVEDVSMTGIERNTPAENSSTEELEESGVNKKSKVQQRFYCDSFPPCNLSFTRSEHLARHIRKHTGERPFQCHCSRRFSRLDNLRQHAQTVHQNEEIPQGSLAATGTRFQRQARSDRVKILGGRAKINQSGCGPIRGHKRNSLSASSIGSVCSTYSNLGLSDTRRPRSLVITGSERARSIPDCSSSSNSQNGFTTPVFHSLPNSQESPRWSSSIQPSATSNSLIPGVFEDLSVQHRRLSVPSMALGAQHTSSPPLQTPMQPMHRKSLSLSTTVSKGAIHSDNQMTRPSCENTNLSDEASRRRTWHPETCTQQGDYFKISEVPNTLPQPSTMLRNPPRLPPVRLPGIESFDPLLRSRSPHSNSSRHGVKPWSLDIRSEPQNPSSWSSKSISQSRPLSEQKKHPSGRQSYPLRNSCIAPIIPQENFYTTSGNLGYTYHGVLPSSQTLSPLKHLTDATLSDSPIPQPPGHVTARSGKIGEWSRYGQENTPINQDIKGKCNLLHFPILSEKREYYKPNQHLLNQSFETSRPRGSDTLRLDALVAAATL